MRTEHHVAIIGAQVCFPGADTLADFESLIQSGRIVGGHLGGRPFGPELMAQGHKLGLPEASYASAALLEDPYGFDARFFGMSGRDARATDPQARLLMTSVFRLLESAGRDIADLQGSRTGLFAGISSNEYQQDILRQPSGSGRLGLHHAVGTAASAAAGRIAHHYNWRGPVQVIDTACSSSLVAVVAACDALRLGRADLAIAGGVNLILSPLASLAFAEAQMLSPNGACRPFDAAANGYVRGEGCGLVLLKRLADVDPEADNVLAIIRAGGVNHNGQTNGLTAPSAEAQTALLNATWDEAGLGDRQLDYIEAHGTGTPLGDPIEMRAVARAIRMRGWDPITVGSVKANIGHLEAAAGIAGLIKALVVGRGGTLPVQTALDRLNPLLERYRTQVCFGQAEGAPRRIASHPALIGVSSFGFSGTNAHVVIEVPPSGSESAKTSPAVGVQVLSISAPDRAGLLQRCSDLDAALSEPAVALSFDQVLHELGHAPVLANSLTLLAYDLPTLARGLRVAIDALRKPAAPEIEPDTHPISLLLGAAQADHPTVPGFAGGEALRAALAGADLPLGALAVQQVALLRACRPRLEIGGLSPREWKELPLEALVRRLVERAPDVFPQNERVLSLGPQMRYSRQTRVAPAEAVDPRAAICHALAHLHAERAIERLPRPDKPPVAHARLPAVPLQPRRYIHIEDADRTATVKTAVAPTRYRVVWSEIASTPRKGVRRLHVASDYDPAAAQALAESLGATWGPLAAAAAKTEIVLPLPPVPLDTVPGRLETLARLMRQAANGCMVHPLAFGQIAHSPAWHGGLEGFWAALVLEHPGLAGCLMQVALPDAAAFAAIGVVLASDGPDRLALARLEAGRWRERRLEGCSDALPGGTDHNTSRLIVTGARSSIAAGLLAKLDLRGLRQIVLVGRSGLDAVPEPAQARRLAAAGVQIDRVALDLCQTERVAEALAKVTADWAPRDAALLHCAGVLGDAAGALETPIESWDTVWGAKVAGLSEMCAVLGDRLDHVQTIGSVSGLWGLSGHAAYCAANGALRVLAEVREEDPSAPAMLSTAWGVWGDSKMLQAMRPDGTALTENVMLDLLGLQAHSPALGHTVLAQGLTQRACGSDLRLAMRPDKLARGLGRHATLFTGLVPETSVPRAPKGQVMQTTVQSEIVEYLRRSEEIELVLPADLRRGFYDLGLNSLGLLGLAEHLTGRFGVTLTANHLFAAPCIEDLAVCVAGLTRSDLTSAPSERDASLAY